MGTKKEIVSDIETHKQRIADIKTKPKLQKLSCMVEVYERLIQELETELSEKGTKLKS